MAFTLDAYNVPPTTTLPAMVPPASGKYDAMFAFSVDTATADAATFALPDVRLDVMHDPDIDEAYTFPPTVASPVTVRAVAVKLL